MIIVCKTCNHHYRAGLANCPFCVPRPVPPNFRDPEHDTGLDDETEKNQEIPERRF